jgi:hypothetical protein
MRAHNRDEPLAAQSFQDCLDMPFAIRIGVPHGCAADGARIDNRDIVACPDKVRLCAVECVGRRVGRKDTPHQRFEFDRKARIPFGAISYRHAWC